MVTRTLLGSILGGNLWLFLEEPLASLLFKTKGDRYSSARPSPEGKGATARAGSAPPGTRGLFRSRTAAHASARVPDPPKHAWVLKFAGTPREAPLLCPGSLDSRAQPRPGAPSPRASPEESEPTPSGDRGNGAAGAAVAVPEAALGP